jgi:hypothetical protein
MKKIILISAMVCAAVLPVYAGNVYVEGGYAYGTYGDAKSMPGFDFGLGYQIAPRITTWVHFLDASATKSSNGVTTDEYENMSFYVSGEYNYPMSNIFSNLPLLWSTSFGVGLTNMRIDHKSDPSAVQGKDSGIFTGIWTGGRYHLTQHIGLYALVGYQMTTQFQSKLSTSKVQGYQIQVGVTATVFGKNSIVDDEY